MLKIEYEIKLNERGRPCIELAPDYPHHTEDKFFAVELSRYYLQRVFNGMGSRFDQHTKDMVDISIRGLGQLGDEMAEIIYDGMISMGEIAVTMGGSHHIQVNSIEERDAIPEKGYFYDGKIFNRQEGLKVLVLNENNESTPFGTPYATIYELKDGVINDNWIKVG